MPPWFRKAGPSLALGVADDWRVILRVDADLEAGTRDFSSQPKPTIDESLPKLAP